MTIELTYDEALDLLNQAVDERGTDYIYNKPTDAKFCQYFHGQEPGCIVGWVLAKKGLTPDDLEDVSQYGQRYADESALHLAEAGIFVADDRTVTLLERVQQLQDDGVQWGAAVADALACVAELDFQYA